MLSFIIPAYNEEKLIGSTIEAIRAACVNIVEEFEIIVADDASDDRTAAIAREHGATVISCNNRKISATRNAGARAARGEYLVFVDADTLVNRGAVTGALAAMKRGAVGGGAGFRFEGQVPFWVRIAAPIGIFVFRLFGFTGGAFLFCTCAAFDAVGGFDEDFYASEEVWMCRALKKQGRFVILREEVITSGRKMRAYSGWEICRMFLGIALRGPNALRRNEHTDLWYSRRDDPEPPK